MASWKLFLVVLPVFLVVDLVWLAIIMKSFYANELGDLARRTPAGLAPRWPAAVLVYLLIPAGIVWFVRPVLSVDAELGQVFARGALYGLVLYGVYDLTNLAVLDRWTLRMTVADIAWGCVLCGSMSVWMVVAERFFLRKGA